MDPFLRPDTPLAPIIMSWAVNKIEETAKFVFKIRLFMTGLRESTDRQLVYLMFIQNVYATITGIYPTSPDEAVALAALQMQAKFGDHNSETHTRGFLSRSGQLRGMVPAPILMRRAMSTWDEDIIAKHAALSGVPKDDPQLTYSRMLLTRDYYGCEFFSAAQVFNDRLPESVMLAVGLGGVFMISMDSKTVLDRYNLGEMYRWGFTADKSFYVELKPTTARIGVPCSVPPRDGKGNIFEWTTPQGRAVSDHLTAYATQLLAEITARRGAPAAAAAAAASTAAAAKGGPGARGATPEEERRRRAAVRIQSVFRGFRIRNRLERDAAVVRIQAIFRGFRARQAFDRMLEELESGM